MHCASSQMHDSGEFLHLSNLLPRGVSGGTQKHDIQRSRRYPEASGAAEARSRRGVGAVERIRCPKLILRTFIFFDPWPAHASCCPRASRGDAPFSRSRGPFGTILGVPDTYVARSKRCDHRLVAPVPSWLIIDLVLLHTIWHVQAEHPTPCAMKAFGVAWPGALGECLCA